MNVLQNLEKKQVNWIARNATEDGRENDQVAQSHGHSRLIHSSQGSKPKQ